MKRADLLIGIAGTGIGQNKPQLRRRTLMRKLIIAPVALLFVAALVLASVAPLFNDGTPVYAHPTDTNCRGGAAAVFGLGSDPDLGHGFGQSTAAIATDGTLSDDVAFLHSVGCAAGLP